METSNRSLLTLAALAAIAVVAFAGAARATDLGPPPPVETWTGFSLGVGGGVAFMDADVNSKASRSDEVGSCWSTPIDVSSGPSPGREDFIDRPCDPSSPFGPPFLTQILDLSQRTTFIDDLSDTGGFFTVQAAYDYQFAARWVLGAFVDADWYDLSAHARQTSSFSQTIASPCIGICVEQLNGNPINLNSKTTVDALISPEWSISVGGRVGWLATPGTLLYFLAAYTHADLDDARVKVSITDPVRNFDIGALTSFRATSSATGQPISL
jgi:hypothetical protein